MPLFYVRDRADVADIPTQKKQTLPATVIIGPNVDRHHIIPGRDHLVVNVAFQPGGLYRFLGIPMSALLSKDALDAVDMLGNELNEITGRLEDALSFTQMKTIVERYLLKHLHKLQQALPIDHTLSMLVKQRGLIKIDQLASHACLSIRQFERVFQKRIGLTPKYYCRLVRFSHAWLIKEKQPATSWIRIANECGYFDQMHLIRDFQEFAGANPSAIELDLLKSPLKFLDRTFD